MASKCAHGLQTPPAGTVKSFHIKAITSRARGAVLTNRTVTHQAPSQHTQSLFSSQNQAVTPSHTCLALNTCSNSYTLMQVSPLSAPWSKWLITNLTPGNLEAFAHLRSLHGLLHREPDRREMEKWNCQAGCYADILGANRMKLSIISWEAVHIKCVLL